MGTTDKTTYQITWRGNEDADASDLPGEGTLADVLQWCAENGVRAELSSENGERRGWVKADGSYALT